MRWNGLCSLPVIVLLVLVACAPAPTRNSASPDASVSSAPAQPATPKTLMFGVRYELNDVAPKITSGSSSEGMKRLFTASLAYLDGNGAVNSYLAESLPTVDTDSWRVFADGRMETTYTLRPNLTWHDGHPL